MDELQLAKKYLSKIASSRSRGIHFNLTFPQFRSILKRKTCAYSGAILNKTNPAHDHYVTLERVDSRRPYEVGNCVAVSKKFNALKSVFEKSVTTDELEKFVKNIKKYERNIGS